MIAYKIKETLSNKMYNYKNRLKVEICQKLWDCSVSRDALHRTDDMSSKPESHGRTGEKLNTCSSKSVCTHGWCVPAYTK